MSLPDTATAAPRRGRNVRRIVLIVGIVIVLAIVGTAVGLETYARKHFSQCIATQLEKSLGSKVSVSFGAKPLLLTYFDHKVGSVTVTSDDAKFGPAVGMKVRATLNDIGMSGNNATVASSSADATWSDDGITQTLQGLVSGVTSDPSAGTLDVKVLGGLADLQLTPHIVNDQIQVDTNKATLLGVIGIPNDLVDNIVKSMTQSLKNYPLDMHPSQVTVTDTGIEVKLTGGASTLQGNDSQTQVSC
ncbi:LmeA family phospholipid-binding protein [Nocardia macrotermitis]|uniref:DUF2993 domain-containing protein n=1 Tax=Nocardia macrotermitis TaxID=2585198 RepID=A0A7K0CXF5_9NOCA|nr:DUF2993 domain-containing protein [Nocardia macrotermitis]MQY18189.1 hypothetical protein [Nocardia macrotermitis]